MGRHAENGGRIECLVDFLYPLGYNQDMSYELHITQEFEKWFSRIRDKSTKRRILARLDRVENCSFGDYEQVASNLFELRFFFGGGLRIYFTFRGNQIILLLVGGDKSSQRRDIARAQSLLDQMEE